MVINNVSILVFWAKVALALEGLRSKEMTSTPKGILYPELLPDSHAHPFSPPV